MHKHFALGLRQHPPTLLLCSEAGKLRPIRYAPGTLTSLEKQCCEAYNHRTAPTDDEELRERVILGISKRLERTQ